MFDHFPALSNVTHCRKDQVTPDRQERPLCSCLCLSLMSEDVLRWLWGDRWEEHLLVTQWDEMFKSGGKEFTKRNEPDIRLDLHPLSSVRGSKSSSLSHTETQSTGETIGTLRANGVVGEMLTQSHMCGQDWIRTGSGLQSFITFLKWGETRWRTKTNSEPAWEETAWRHSDI